MNNECAQKVKRWVELDNAVEVRKTKLKAVSDEKKVLEEEILDYIETNDMQNLQINITGGHIRFAEQRGFQGFTLKSVKDGLAKYFESKGRPDDPMIENIYEYLVKNRDTRTKLTIKRTLTS